MLNINDENQVPPKSLEGESAPNQFGVRDGDGITRDPCRVIFPILSHVNEEYKFIGTGFFIGQPGLFISAKHVLADVLNEDGKPKGDLYISQILPDSTSLLRPIHRFYTNGIDDIAVGICFQMKNNSDGSDLKNTQLKLTTEVPEIKSQVVTFAYPNTLKINGNIDNQSFVFYPNFYSGTLEEYYPCGRDKVLLPGESFRTSIYLHPGSSGGPVFDNKGRVFAINTSSQDIKNISFVSSIKAILDIVIDDVNLMAGGPTFSLSIRELTKMGHLFVSGPI